MKYRHVFVGGTFDGLHRGHEAVLTRAFRDGERVTIGVTSDLFIRRYKSKTNLKFKVQKTTNSFKKRKQALEQWLHKKKYTSRVTIISIDDPYEPAASGDFDALMVTRDNKETGEEINRRRKAKGLHELVLIEIPLFHAQDHAPISSTRVRNGEIDRHGRLIMPQSLIPALRKPLGKIISEKDLGMKIKDLRRKMIITVGDLTTKTFLDQGIVPNLAILDGMVGRKPYRDAIDMFQPEKARPFQATSVKSGPGFISREATEVIHRYLDTIRRTDSRNRSSKAIIVEGEEDLLALPAILYTPIGSVVLYGQPGRGMVIVHIDQKVKTRVQKLIKKFLVTE